MAKKKKLSEKDYDTDSEQDTDTESTNKKSGKNSKDGFVKKLTAETRQGVFAVGSFTLAIIISLAIWHKAGRAGQWLFNPEGTSFYSLVGVGYYLLPLLLIALGISFLRNLHKNFDSSKLIGAGIFLVSILGIIDIVDPQSGGYTGKWIAYPFVALFEASASLVFLSAFVIVSLLIAFNEELDLKSLFSFKKDKTEDDGYEGVDESNLKLSMPTEPVEEKMSAREIAEKEAAAIAAALAAKKKGRLPKSFRKN